MAKPVKRPKNMNLTDEQIVYLWTHAEEPSKQLKILAELNATSEAVIELILAENGIDTRATRVRSTPTKSKRGYINEAIFAKGTGN